jgi:hypothetical protein
VEFDSFISKLDGVKKAGNGWQAQCPAHDDRQASLSISEGDDGRILIKCFAGCTAEEIVRALNLELKDLFPAREGGRGGINPPEQHCNRATAGCTLKQYAEAKALPVDFLQSLGVSEISYLRKPAVRIPYMDQAGNEACVQFRLSLDQEPRFKWRRGDKPIPYGLWRLSSANDYIIVVEGASDAQTLWHRGFPTIGLPGAGTWKEAFAAYLQHVEKIFLWVEPDQGGETFQGSMGRSSIQDRLYLIVCNGWKDPSGLYLSDPANFAERFQELLDKAIPWVEIRRQQEEAEISEAWSHCQHLAGSENILDLFAAKLPAVGIVGESKLCKIIYLALTARLFEKIPSLGIKGPSAGGKSFVVECVCGFFPDRAYYAITSMSEHALAYDEEPLSHRFLIIYEASGLSGDLATYLTRTLLSEGRIRHKTVVKTSDGMRPLTIEREGPTGLILTTTAINLHPENETRMMSLTVSDTKDQTKAILRRLALQSDQSEDLTDWVSLQVWLQAGEHRVVIPFASTLAEMIPPLAVRLRRDFSSILSLIQAHALLHRATRERDERGRIMASFADYEAVRDLSGEFIAEGLGALVSDTIRATIQTVKELNKETVSVKEVAEKLGLDKSATSRRIRQALAGGYLINLEEKKGKSLKLKIGDPLPEEIDLLPSVDDLVRECDCCTVAATPEEVQSPPPPYDEEEQYAYEERIAIMMFESELSEAEAKER